MAHGEREAASLSHTPTQGLEAPPTTVRSRQIAHLSLNFVLDMTAHGLAGLKPFFARAAVEGWWVLFTADQ